MEGTDLSNSMRAHVQGAERENKQEPSVEGLWEARPVPETGLGKKAAQRCPSYQLGSSRDGNEGHPSCFSLGPDTRTHCFIRQKCLDFTVSIYSRKFMQCECLSDQRG